MRLKRVKLKNIRSYDTEEIIFPEGSTILSGDIGSGKTSVLLGIEFALFGLQPGQKGTSLLRHDQNEGSVELEIEVDGKTIILERGLKRGKSVTQSFSKLSVDGEEEETSVTELKNKVLDFLNYPKEFAKKTNILYRFTVYTPQEEMKQIILESSEARLDTLRHIFGIDKYKKIRENTDLYTSELRSYIRSYEGQIKDLEEIKNKLSEKKHHVVLLKEVMSKLNKELKQKKEERENFEEQMKDIEDKIKQKEKYEKEIEKFQVMLNGKKELSLNTENEINSLKEEIDEVEKVEFSKEKMKQLEEKIYQKIEDIDSFHKSYMELLGKINSGKNKISEIEDQKSQISSLEMCPTCFQDVSDEYKKNIMRKFDENSQKFEKQIQSLNEEKNELSSKIEKMKSEKSEMEEQFSDLKLVKMKLESLKEKQAKLGALQKRKDSTLSDVNLIEKQIKDLKELSIELKKYENIYENKKKQLDNLKTEEKEKEIEIGKKEKEQEMTQQIIKDIKQEIDKKNEIKNKVKKISELEHWLSSSFLSLISFTEKNIMLKLREEFSKLFNEWFNILVPEIFNVRLNEDFTPVIEQQDYQLDYDFLSGGERTAIALAYRLALNQILNSLLSKIKTRDIVILDEPTDGFSEQQLDKMRDVLNELNVKQLIIVSHESKIESFVENIIKFKKEAGLTKIEV